MRLVFKSIRQHAQDSILNKSLGDDDCDDDASSMHTDEGEEVDPGRHTSPMTLWARRGKGKDGDVAWVQHKIACLFKYITHVVRPRLQAERLEDARLRRVYKAKWKICALLVREYRNNKQTAMLGKRKKEIGRVKSAVVLEMWVGANP